MLIKTILTAVSLTALLTSAMAQGFSGGELTIDAYGFSDGGDSTVVNYSAALEYSINRNVSIAGDVSIYDLSILSDDVTNFTLHGIFHVNDQTSIGGFYGVDSLSGNGSAFGGFEAGYETGALGVEGYIAIYDNDDDTSVFGLSGEYEISDTISATANIGLGDIGNVDYTRISAGAEYSFAQGPSVYAELGNVTGGGTDSGYIGLGANIEFGAARGTTFDRRGIFETVIRGD